MTKSIDDMVVNYLQSIPKAMQNYKKFLIRSKNIQTKIDLAKRTTDYGINMLYSGMSENMTSEAIADIFEEQAAICKSLEMYCREYL